LYGVTIGLNIGGNAALGNGGDGCSLAAAATLSAAATRLV
jgi:hypothetical protein